MLVLRWDKDRGETNFVDGCNIIFNQTNWNSWKTQQAFEYMSSVRLGQTAKLQYKFRSFLPNLARDSSVESNGRKVFLTRGASACKKGRGKTSTPCAEQQYLIYNLHKTTFSSVIWKQKVT